MVAMRRKKENTDVKSVSVEDKILDVNATMQGSLRFDDPVNLRISGRFEGTLDTKGKLMVGSKAEIKANINGEDVHIEGDVTGNIKATGLLKLSRTARLNGDVETARLSVEEGAVLIGQVRMEASTGATSDDFSTDGIMDAYEVAKYLEVDTDKINDWASNGVLPGTQNGGVWTFDKSKVDEWVAQEKVKG